jgi:sRNA-binding protein
MTVKKDRELLAQLYPALFTQPGERRRPKLPLKIGTRQDILDRAPCDENGPISVRRIRAALKDYVSGPRYQKALAFNPNRYDLDGNVAGSVEEAIAKRAKERVRKAPLKPKVAAMPTAERLS